MVGFMNLAITDGSTLLIIVGMYFNNNDGSTLFNIDDFINLVITDGSMSFNSEARSTLLLFSSTGVLVLTTGLLSTKFLHMVLTFICGPDLIRLWSFCSTMHISNSSLPVVSTFVPLVINLVFNFSLRMVMCCWSWTRRVL